MKKHTVTVEDLIQWKIEKESEMLLYASDSSQSKKLLLSLNGKYVVKQGDVVVLSILNPFAAVEIYNSL